MKPIAVISLLVCIFVSVSALSISSAALAQTAGEEPVAAGEEPVAAGDEALGPASQRPELTIRLEKPLVVSFGGLWPKGIGPSVSYQVLPRLALGAHAGLALLFADISAFGRWYFADTPESWYVEGLAVQHFPLGSGSGYWPGAPFFSLNALGGWEQRWSSGASFNIGAGLGLSPNMTPNALIGLINLDLSFGYAF